LTHKDGDSVPGIPRPPERKAQFKSELEQRLSFVEESLKELAVQIKDSKLSGAGKKELLDKLHQAQLNLTPNLSFVAESFGEHVERIVEQAKIEVGAYTQSVIQRAGIEAMHGAVPISLPASKASEQ